MKKTKYTKELLIPIVKESNSYADVCRKLSIAPNTGAQTYITKKIKEYHIDTSHFTGRGWLKGKKITTNPGKTLDEICVVNSTYKSSSLLKKLVKEGKKKYQCEICNLTIWRENPISLELHHINGCHTDNRLENLQILCPNCHSQVHNSYKGMSAQKETSDVEVG